MMERLHKEKVMGLGAGLRVRDGKQRLEQWTTSRRYSPFLSRTNMRMGVATIYGCARIA